MTLCGIENILHQNLQKHTKESVCIKKQPLYMKSYTINTQKKVIMLLD